MHAVQGKGCLKYTGRSCHASKTGHSPESQQGTHQGNKYNEEKRIQRCCHSIKRIRGLLLWQANMISGPCKLVLLISRNIAQWPSHHPRLEVMQDGYDKDTYIYCGPL